MKQNSKKRWNKQRNLQAVASVFFLFAILLIYILIAVQVSTAGLPSELGTILGFVWGQVTLFDLYVGLILSALWVWYRESSSVVSTLWTVSFFGLGFLMVAFYVGVHLLLMLRHKKPESFFMGRHSRGLEL